jgi:Zn finger protein HypA/HybF involved in hydrogenase expression
MPIDEVKIVRMCQECRTEIETMTVKQDNMRLFSDELVWCPKCQAEKPEVRDVAGRRSAIQKEQGSYPKPRPAR